MLWITGGTRNGMDLESHLLLDKLLLDSRRQGLVATPEHRRRLQEIDVELNKIEIEYLHHLQLAEHLDIRVPGKELEGVPQRSRNAPRDEQDINDADV